MALTRRRAHRPWSVLALAMTVAGCSTPEPDAAIVPSSPVRLTAVAQPGAVLLAWSFTGACGGFSTMVQRDEVTVAPYVPMPEVRSFVPGCPSTWADRGVAPGSRACYRATVTEGCYGSWSGKRWEQTWRSDEVCVTALAEAAPSAVASLAVVGTSPAAGARDVARRPNITVQFNEAIDPVTVDRSDFTVTGPSGAVSGWLSACGDFVAFVPMDDLASQATYRVAIGAPVADLIGRTLAPTAWEFTTW